MFGTKKPLSGGGTAVLPQALGSGDTPTFRNIEITNLSNGIIKKSGNTLSSIAGLDYKADLVNNPIKDLTTSGFVFNDEDNDTQIVKEKIEGSDIEIDSIDDSNLKTITSANKVAWGAITIPSTVNFSNVNASNLSVLGTTTFTNVQNVNVTDAIINMAIGNTVGDIVDSGVLMTYNDGVQRYSGFMRDASDKKWYLTSDNTSQTSSNYTAAGLGTLVSGGMEATSMSVNNGARTVIARTAGGSDYTLTLPSSSSGSGMQRPLVITGMSGSNLTLGWGQAIGTNSSPTFPNVVFSSLTPNTFVKTNSAKVLVSTTISTSDLTPGSLSCTDLTVSSLGGGTAGYVKNNASGLVSTAASIPAADISGSFDIVTRTTGSLPTSRLSGTITNTLLGAGSIDNSKLASASNAASANSIALRDSSGGLAVNSLKIKNTTLNVPNTNTMTYNMPTGLPASSGRILSCDTSGNMSWVPASTAGSSYNQSLNTTDSPSFVSLGLSGIGSGIVLCDNLGQISTTTSLDYSLINGRPNQSLDTTSSPTFAGLTLGSGSGYLVSNSGGVVSKIATIDYNSLSNRPTLYSANQSLNTTNTPTFAGLELTGIGSGIVLCDNLGQISTTGSIDGSLLNDNSISLSKLSSAGISTNATANTLVKYSGSGGITASALTLGSGSGYLFSNSGGVVSKIASIDYDTLINKPILYSANQSLNTGDSPTFNSLTLSGLGGAGILVSNSSGVLSRTATIDYATQVSNKPTLYSSNQSLNTSDSPTFAGVTLSGLGGAGYLISSAGGVLSRLSAIDYNTLSNKPTLFTANQSVDTTSDVKFNSVTTGIISSLVQTNIDGKLIPVSSISGSLISNGSIPTTKLANASYNNVGDAICVRNASGDLIVNNLQVSGDLTVLGNSITANVSSLNIEDSLVKFANGNSTSVLDIGFYGQYESAGTRYCGFVRDATDGRFKIIDYDSNEPGESVTYNSLGSVDVQGLAASLISTSSLSATTISCLGAVAAGALSLSNNGGSINSTGSGMRIDTEGLTMRSTTSYPSVILNRNNTRSVSIEMSTSQPDNTSYSIKLPTVLPTSLNNMLLNTNGQIEYSPFLDDRVCYVYRTAQQSIPQNTYTTVIYSTAAVDPVGMFSLSNPTRITVPEAGLYMVGYSVIWGQQNGGIREHFVSKNGDTAYKIAHAFGIISASDNRCFISESSVVLLAAGDYLQMTLWQSSNNTINLTPTVAGFTVAEQSTKFWVKRIR